MLSVSTEFKDTIKELSIQSDGKVDIVNSSGTLSFDSDDIIKIEIFGSAFHKDTVLGTIAQHSLTLEILGDLTKDINLNKENIVQPYIGLVLSTGTEYVQYQDFLITEITYSDTTNITKIIGTDNLIKLNHEFVDTNSYPMTLKAYLESVLTDCGLDLENTSFFNDNFSVVTRPFTDFVNAKEIVSRVAELAASYVVINKVTNKVELKPAFRKMPDIVVHDTLANFTHTQLSVYTHNQLAFGLSTENDLDNATKRNYWDFKLKDNYFGQNGINTLVMRISQVEGENNSKENSTNVAIDGAVELVVEDNPFINSEAKRLSVIDNYFDVVDEFKYNPYVLDYRGYPYLEIGDIIVIEQMSEEKVAVPIYEFMIKYDGGLVGKISANSLNPVTTLYKYFSPVEQKIRNAEILVDKANAEISLKVSADEVVSAINLSPETIKINTAKLDVSAYVTFTNLETSGQTSINGANIQTGTITALGAVTAGSFNIGSGRFQVSSAGDLTASNVNLSGTISASAGTIGGFAIGSNTIASSNFAVGMSPAFSSGGFNYSFWAGGSTPTSAPFRVLTNGGLRADNAIITGTINASSGTIGGASFSSDTNALNLAGQLYATGLSITGTSQMRDTIPQTNGVWDLGRIIGATQRWRIIYLTNQPNVSSDIRLKEDVEVVGNEYDDLILNTEIIKYKMVGGDDAQIGINANQFDEQFGDKAKLVVKMGEDGYYGANYVALVPMLIKTVQSLEKRIKELENGN